MKRIVILAVLAFGSIALVGCGASGTPSTKSTEKMGDGKMGDGKMGDKK